MKLKCMDNMDQQVEEDRSEKTITSESRGGLPNHLTAHPKPSIHAIVCVLFGLIQAGFKRNRSCIGNIYTMRLCEVS